MVVQVAFSILHKISPLENALTEMTLRKFIYLALTQRPLINIHCNNKDRQILCEINTVYGRTFFCVCKPLQKYKFYFYSTSKYIIIPVKSNHPQYNLILYII